MAEQRVTTKAELLADIEDAWTTLNRALDRLSPIQLTTPKDAQGWTVKDHIVHLAAWERSGVFLLKSKPRHEGLGVDEVVYLRGDDDEINAAIQQQSKELTLDAVLAEFRDTHQELLAALQPLTDEDLNQRYRHYLPDEPGEGDGPRAIDVIYGNTSSHYRDHWPWMEALALAGDG